MALKTITKNELLSLNKSQGRFDNVLDVGCGNQIYKPFIEFNRYQGIDVEVSGHNKNLMKVDRYFDGENIPFSDCLFDLVLCSEVLEHVLNPEKLVSEMKRVVKDGGLILITVPSMWGEHEVPFDFRRYTSYGIKKIVTDAGLTIIKYQKESAGVLSLIRLGLSQVNASSNGRFVKSFAKFWLKVSYVILEIILKVEMPGIYLTNVITLKK
ncbi:class I SAM-dependent methyltransferase [Pseudomonadales bacterium]|nr:class I SAM-dependent methyltransferase [Pseudomonadales bacterium]